MAVEIHRSGALDAALDEALATIEGELKVGDRLNISGTLTIQGVSSDPDGTPLIQGEFTEGTVSAEQVEEPESPTAQPTSGPSASVPVEDPYAPAADDPATLQAQAEQQQTSMIRGEEMFPEVTRTAGT